MPLGLNINNPQEENPTLVSTPSIGPVTYGGNVLGSGSSATQGGAQSTASTPDFNTILTYGVIALFAVFVIQRLEK